MASKRTGRKFLSDAVINARRASTPRVQRVTIISNGVKYKDGKAVARVCQAPTALHSSSMLRKI